MSIKYRVVKDLRLVLTFISGGVDDHDLLIAVESLKAWPGFDPAFAELADARGVNSTVTFGGLMNAGSQSPFALDSRRAFVVKELIDRGRANQLGALSSKGSRSFRVLESVAEAIEWLGYSGKEERILALFEELRGECNSGG